MPSGWVGFATMAALLLQQAASGSGVPGKGAVRLPPARFTAPRASAAPVANGRGGARTEPVLTMAMPVAFGFLAPKVKISDQNRMPVLTQPSHGQASAATLTLAQIEAKLSQLYVISTTVTGLIVTPIVVAPVSAGPVSGVVVPAGANAVVASADVQGSVSANTGFPDQLPDAVITARVERKASTPTTRPTALLTVTARPPQPARNDQVAVVRDPQTGGLQIVHINR